MVQIKVYDRVYSLNQLINLCFVIFSFYIHSFMKLCMNANIVKNKFFYLMVYNLRGHWSGHKVVFLIIIHFFFDILFVWNLIKIRMIANIIKTQIFHKMKFDLKGHWWLFVLWKDLVSFHRFWKKISEC